MNKISIQEFYKVQLKIGEILECKKHENANKLLVFQIKIDDEVRQIVSSIAENFSPEELIGQKVVVVANLEPIILRGVQSNGMILTAETAEKLVLLTADIDCHAVVS